LRAAASAATPETILKLRAMPVKTNEFWMSVEGLVGRMSVFCRPPAAGRAHPVVGEAEVDRHPERKATRVAKQDDAGTMRP